MVKKMVKRRKEKMTEVDRIIKSIALLGDIGLYILSIECGGKFLKKARLESNPATKKDFSVRKTLHGWVDKDSKKELYFFTKFGEKVFDKKSLKEKGKNFEGMMYGINFYSR